MAKPLYLEDDKKDQRDDRRKCYPVDIDYLLRLPSIDDTNYGMMVSMRSPNPSFQLPASKYTDCYCGGYGRCMNLLGAHNPNVVLQDIKALEGAMARAQANEEENARPRKSRKRKRNARN